MPGLRGRRALGERGCSRTAKWPHTGLCPALLATSPALRHHAADNGADTDTHRAELQPCLPDRINCLAFGQDYFCSEQDCYHLIENNYPMQIGFKLAG